MDCRSLLISIVQDSVYAYTNGLSRLIALTQAVRDAEQEAIDPEKRQALKAWLINQVKMTIIKAQSKVDDHAAYGALVLKGVEQLRILLGMNKDIDPNDKKYPP